MAKGARCHLDIRVSSTCSSPSWCPGARRPVQCGPSHEGGDQEAGQDLHGEADLGDGSTPLSSHKAAASAHLQAECLVSGICVLQRERSSNVCLLCKLEHHHYFETLDVKCLIVFTIHSHCNKKSQHDICEGKKKSC